MFGHGRVVHRRDGARIRAPSWPRAARCSRRDRQSADRHQAKLLRVLRAASSKRSAAAGHPLDVASSPPPTSSGGHRGGPLSAGPLLSPQEMTITLPPLPAPGDIAARYFAGVYARASICLLKISCGAFVSPRRIRGRTRGTRERDEVGGDLASEVLPSICRGRSSSRSRKAPSRDAGGAAGDRVHFELSSASAADRSISRRSAHAPQRQAERSSFKPDSPGIAQRARLRSVSASIQDAAPQLRRYGLDGPTTAAVFRSTPLRHPPAHP